MNTRPTAASTETAAVRSTVGFPGHGEHAPLDLGPVTRRQQEQVVGRLLSRDFDAWSAAVAKVGNCARRIRLSGRSTTIDTVTGEIISEYSSAGEPLG